MLLYHGSPKIIGQPQYGYGSLHNDYGQGFYCTENIELAKEWACPSIINGFVNKYELSTNNLKILNLNQNNFHILNWIALLINYRIFSKRSPLAKQASTYILQEFLPDITKYDIIIGYRADDSYFSYAKDFLNNTISVNQLATAMKLGELGEQIVLMSEKAFQAINFIGYDEVDGKTYNNLRTNRENIARNAYLNQHGTNFALSNNDLYILDIIRQQVKNNDPRLF